MCCWLIVVVRWLLRGVRCVLRVAYGLRFAMWGSFALFVFFGGLGFVVCSRLSVVCC